MGEVDGVQDAEEDKFHMLSLMYENVYTGMSLLTS